MGKKKTSITLDNGTLEDLDEMAQSTRRSRSGMIGVLVDLFKFMIGREVEFDEDDDEITEGD